MNTSVFLGFLNAGTSFSVNKQKNPLFKGCRLDFQGLQNGSSFKGAIFRQETRQVLSQPSRPLAEIFLASLTVKNKNQDTTPGKPGPLLCIQALKECLASAGLLCADKERPPPSSHCGERNKQKCSILTTSPCCRHLGESKAHFCHYQAR